MPSILRADWETTLVQYRAYLQRQRVGENSIEQYISQLRQFHKYEPSMDFNYVIPFLLRAQASDVTRAAIINILKMNELSYLIDKLPKRERNRPRKRMPSFPADEQVRGIIAAIPNPIHRIVAWIQYDAGLRSASVFKLQKERIKEEGGNVRFYAIEKGRKEKYFFVSRETEEKVKKFLADPVIKRRHRPFLARPNPIELKSELRRYQLSLESASKKVGVKFTSHDFRRHYATNYYQWSREQYLKGEFKVDPLVATQQMLGHANVETTLKYIRFAENNSPDLARRFAEERRA